MKEHLRTRDLVGTANHTVESLSRRRWTTAELLALAESGHIDPDLEFELIHGEVVAMTPTGEHHENVSDDLADYLIRRRPADIRVTAEPQLNLTDDTFTEPDIVVRQAAIRMPRLRGETALLVIKVADTSLQYDTTTKAQLYADHGVREYWVINARTLLTRVHRAPSASGYMDVREIAGSEPLVPLLAPALAVRLVDLEAETG
jgi:Uma2 family endonuclease